MKTLKTFIRQAREKKISDEEIKQRLLDAGWSGATVYEALESDPDLVPPPPPAADDYSESAQKAPATEGKPDSTVNVLSGGFSSRGFEYLIYFVALGISALSIGALLHNTINLIFDSQKYGFYEDIIPMAASALLVALPIFIYLMLRLKKAELAKPEIKQDPSRRRAVQLLMIVTFLVGVIKLISYINNILSPDIYNEASALAETLHAAVTIGIAGGIFGYYWRDQAEK